VQAAAQQLFSGGRNRTWRGGVTLPWLGQWFIFLNCSLSLVVFHYLALVYEGSLDHYPFVVSVALDKTLKAGKSSVVGHTLSVLENVNMWVLHSHRH
jgi:hypothetical protein